MYEFSLDQWADSVKVATTTCPHAVTRDLTPWESEVLDTSTIKKLAEGKGAKSNIEVCLNLEFEHFNDLKKKMFFSRRRDDRPADVPSVSPREFRLSRYNVAYGILKCIFSPKNPHLMHALLELPERTKFTGGQSIADLFRFQNQAFINAIMLQKIMRQIRQRYAQRGLNAEESNALYEYLRMKPIQQGREPRNQGDMSKQSRGGQIGLAALQKSYPLAGRHSGESAMSSNTQRQINGGSAARRRNNNIRNLRRNQLEETPTSAPNLILL